MLPRVKPSPPPLPTIKSPPPPKPSSPPPRSLPSPPPLDLKPSPPPPQHTLNSSPPPKLRPPPNKKSPSPPPRARPPPPPHFRAHHPLPPLSHPNTLLSSPPACPERRRQHSPPCAGRHLSAWLHSWLEVSKAVLEAAKGVARTPGVTQRQLQTLSTRLSKQPSHPTHPCRSACRWRWHPWDRSQNTPCRLRMWTAACCCLSSFSSLIASRHVHLRCGWPTACRGLRVAALARPLQRAPSG